MFIVTKNFIIILSLFLLVSCVSYKPIFEENYKYIEVGEEHANQDFKSCKFRSEQQLEKYKMAKIANEAKRKALIGGIVGGVSGLIFGNSTQSIVGGLISGAVVGGAVGGMSSYGEDKVGPDVIKQRLITRCLNSQGYEIIGWY